MLLRLFALSTVASAFVVVDKVATIPGGWKEIRQGAPDDHVLLNIALRQQSSDILEQRVIDISTPGNPSYGKHLGRDEVRSLTAPSSEAVSEVTAWLKKNGVSSVEVNNDWIKFGTTVKNANALLNTRFAWYDHSPEDGRYASSTKLRTLSYSLPDELVQHIDMVQPTTRFGRIGSDTSRVFTSVKYADELEMAADSANTRVPVTPDLLKSLYGINYTAKASGNLVAVASFLEEYARYSDLDLFKQKYVPQAAGQSFDVELINGGKNDQNSSEDSGEANLDVQTVLGISHPIPLLQYSTGGYGPAAPGADPTGNEPYLEFLQHLSAVDDDKLPSVLSVSYGEGEDSVPRDFAYKICNQFLQLGARGVSVIFASGDGGPGGSCKRLADNSTYLSGIFPGSCPWVTAVGATNRTNPETVATFSGGGFSTVYPAPIWQRNAVDGFLNTLGNKYNGYFNRYGRAIPDVSAQGVDFAIFDKGNLSLIGGTSASVPAFSGIVALLNAARKEAGLPRLGFLNPWLYWNHNAFTDITHGASRGCLKNPVFAPNGVSWEAVSGWDPATGLGTPKFAELLKAAAPGVENK
ncbi:Tripeptidyl-peptidase sed2 [Cladobotryum mycophilum]|uniref:tripeptidyl-peptidase II n=1 Tax=Cladobotryum mycophilum TaxID=491253 RepID=A0ABR0S776_9HYPO